MSYMTSEAFRHNPVTALRGSIAAAMEAAAIRRARNREYRRLRDELLTLSTRDLNDIGIHRSQIEEIARQHAYGA